MKVSIPHLMVSATLLGVLAACSQTKPHVEPPPSVQNPPLYPNAQQVQVTPTVFYKDIPAKLVTFRTDDKPDTVLAFYRDALRKEGWTLSDDEAGDSLRFFGPRGCPEYTYYVIAK